MVDALTLPSLEKFQLFVEKIDDPAVKAIVLLNIPNRAHLEDLLSLRQVVSIRTGPFNLSADVRTVAGMPPNSLIHCKVSSSINDERYIRTAGKYWKIAIGHYHKNRPEAFPLHLHEEMTDPEEAPYLWVNKDLKPLCTDTAANTVMATEYIHAVLKSAALKTWGEEIAETFSFDVVRQMMLVDYIQAAMHETLCFDPNIFLAEAEELLIQDAGKDMEPFLFDLAHAAAVAECIKASESRDQVRLMALAKAGYSSDSTMLKFLEL